MKPLLIPIDCVTVSDRLRSDLGDIDELAGSIDRYGMIQPIIVNQDNQLIAGGRRLAACRQLGWTTIPAVYRETLSMEELHELELEENVRRKDMTWQERVLAVAQIHRSHTLNAALTGSRWGFNETGELLGIKAKSHVWYSVEAARLLLSGDEETAKCSSLKDVIQLMAKRKEDEARQILVSLSTTKNLTEAKQRCDALVKAEEQSNIVRVSLPNHAQLAHSLQASWPQYDHIIMAHSLQASWPQYDHIISDPPYAIDMSMLAQEGTGMKRIEDVEKEHDVSENCVLLKRVVERAAATLPAHGFLVLWCDAIWFRWLVSLAEDVGLSAQRWPLVWCKTSACINQAAQYNWTKSTEFVFVAHRPGATLVAHQPTNYIVAPNEKPAGAHPFYKPHALWRWLYRAVTLPGQTVLDPFAGEGSSVCAAIEHGLRPIGIEVNEKHFNVMTENIRATYQRLLGKEGVVFK